MQKYFIPVEGRKMGEPNAALNVYMSKKERIRDVCEYYTGEKIPWDFEIEEESGFYSLQDGKKLTHRERDLFRKVKCQGDTKFLLGIENQMTVNLTFPQRILEMDSLEYGRQAKNIRDQNKKSGVKYKKGDDFKYGFRKEDRLKPVCNLKLYWGKDISGMPASLKDITDMRKLPESINRMFNDYRIHTVHMLEIPDEVLWKMKSDLKYVIGVLKRTGRGRRYQQFILENSDYFENMPVDAYDVISVCAGIRKIEKYLEFKKENGEERVDMCRAIYEIKRDAKREGRKEGKKEGRKEGKREGKYEAILELLGDYGTVPKEIRRLITKEKDMEKLGIWLRLAAKAQSIEEFCLAME